MIRPIQLQDVKYITDIYNEYILNSTYTFETEPISEDEMRLRIAEIFPTFPFSYAKQTIKLWDTAMHIPGNNGRLTDIPSKRQYTCLPDIEEKDSANC